jgi:hypothetical protein
MQFDIRHRTIYRYARPVVMQPHRLMLYPRRVNPLATRFDRNGPLSRESEASDTR